jgi:hypothetical protein
MSSNRVILWGPQCSNGTGHLITPQWRTWAYGTVVAVTSRLHSLPASGEACLVDYDSRAGGRGAPFPNHREENRRGEKDEGQARVSHRFNYPMRIESKGLRTDPYQLGGASRNPSSFARRTAEGGCPHIFPKCASASWPVSKAHDVIAAVYEDDFAGDSAARIRC